MTTTGARVPERGGAVLGPSEAPRGVLIDCMWSLVVGRVGLWACRWVAGGGCMCTGMHIGIGSGMGNGMVRDVGIMNMGVEMDGEVMDMRITLVAWPWAQARVCSAKVGLQRATCYVLHAD